MSATASRNTQNTPVEGFLIPAIIGFACNQGFIFSLFYSGENTACNFGSLVFERIDLCAALLCMALAFFLLRFASVRVRNFALSQPMLWCYACLSVAGSFAPVLGAGSLLALVAESVLVGVSAGALLAAWGRALSYCPNQAVLRLILCGAGIGAALCLFFSALPWPDALLLLNLLPLGSVSALACFPHKPALPAENRSALTLRDLTGKNDNQVDAVALTHKMLAGMAVFGLVAGVTDTVGSQPGMASAPAWPASLLMFIFFVVATIQQVGESFDLRRLVLDPARQDQGKREHEHPLQGMYRLAFVVIMAGFLLLPVLKPYGVPGEAIVLAGYLGFTYVMVSLFVIAARIEQKDPVFSLARGFMVLYVGEAAGIACANILNYTLLAGQSATQAENMLLAGAALVALGSYLFLFTERDFEALISWVDEEDPFENACRAFAEAYSLSPREAEVLPFALRGRTSERIAEALCVSKSTVDTHLRRIYQKTGVHGRQGLIDLAENTFLLR